MKRYFGQINFELDAYDDIQAEQINQLVLAEVQKYLSIHSAWAEPMEEDERE